jgi:hypothetical protein
MSNGLGLLNTCIDMLGDKEDGGEADVHGKEFSLNIPHPVKYKLY